MGKLPVLAGTLFAVLLMCLVLMGASSLVQIVNGGTGASTAAGALTNLGAAPLASPTFTGTVTLPDGTQITSSGFNIAAHTVNGASLALSATSGNLVLNSSGGSVITNGVSIDTADSSGNFLESATANIQGIGWQFSDSVNNFYMFPTAATGYPIGIYLAPSTSTGAGIIDPSSGFQTVFDTSSPTAATTLKIPAVSGTVTMGVIPTANTGHALCETTTHTIGHCTTVVSATGTCTCT